MNKALLLSIKPRFADAIFAGTKTFELRKVRPRVMAGDLVLVYVTVPRCRLEGAFRVGTVLEMAPEKLWLRVRGKCGVTKAEFMAYYAEKTTAFAIGVAEAWLLDTAVQLRELRSERIIPPQGYRYLSVVETTALMGSE
jgi:predicted transcriptional regulator